jgi:hypothetical protein
MIDRALAFKEKSWKALNHSKQALENELKNYELASKSIEEVKVTQALKEGAEERIVALAHEVDLMFELIRENLASAREEVKVAQALKEEAEERCVADCIVPFTG